jgi:zinc protease
MITFKPSIAKNCTGVHSVMKMLLLVLFFLIGCSHSNKENSRLDESIHLKVSEFQLDNGLKVLVAPNKKLPIFSLYMFYKVGGKNEVPGITGASHFLEHMMFKGARKFGKNTIDFIIEGSGGSTNAYTTNDHTVYYENLPASKLSLILDIESDRLDNLLLDASDFEKERAVVLEERRMRYENSPRGQLYLELMQSLYQGTPYGRSVIGDVKDLKSVTRDQIHQYFKKFYAPNNLTMVIVGDVDPNEVKAIVKEKFSSIQSSEKVLEAHNEIRDELFKVNLTQSKIVKKKGASPNPIFMLAYPSFKAGNTKGYALDILGSIIGSGMSSALMRDYILTQKPVSTKIYGGNYSLERAGYFYVGGDLVKGVKVESFVSSLERKLKGYCETEVTEKNVQKVKNNYLHGLYSSLDSNAGLAQFLGERELLYGDWKYYQEELRNYEKVTIQEIINECKNIFNRPSVFVSVWEKN